MADMRLVHNTTLTPVVVSSDGRRVLGCSTDTIDITEPRAKKYLGYGTLHLVSQGTPEAPQAPAPAPKTSKSK